MEFIAILVMVIVVLAVQYYLYAKTSFQHFEYTCHFTKEEVMEGDEVGLVETVINRKWLPLPWLKAELSTSQWLEYAGDQSDVLYGKRFVSSFFALRSYQKISRTWKVKCLRRGVFEIHRVDLVDSDLLGFSSFSHSVTVYARLTVLPRPLKEENATSLLRYLNGEVPVRRQLLADPFFLAGVQEYTGLEPMKRIHWTATAREGRLMVFQNQYTARKNLTIFLNTQSRPGFSSPTGDDPQLEDCIRFCAYLFRVAADSDTPFRFLSNGVDSESKKPVVTAESWGEGFALEQSRVLARLTAAHQSPLDAFLQQQDPLLSSDELIFISTYFDEVLQSFARQRARAGAHVTVFVRGTVLPSDLDPGVYDIYALQGTARQQKEGDPQ